MSALGRQDEHAALVALLRTRPRSMTWPDIMDAVLTAGNARTVWDRLHQPALFADPAGLDPLDTARVELARWSDDGIAVHTMLDPQYPARLRTVARAPAMLFSRGQLMADERAVAVIGLRVASDAGRAMAAELARALVRDGITVLSGLAQGIDTAAHRSAVEAGGRTVAVIGTGIDRYFPACNRDLQDTIAARGLLLSQFWPAASPTRHSFPLRNATMAGYGLATVVVEAGETSGARIQARIAAGLGRPVILTDLVLRGTPWAHQLLARPGVYRARSIADVIDGIQQIDGAAAG